jgi:hypothetical protein
MPVEPARRSAVPHRHPSRVLQPAPHGHPSRTRATGLLAALGFALTLLTAGCASGPAAAPEPDDPIAAARELPDAGGVVKSGDATATCGEFVLPQGVELDPAALDCLADASAAGASAELAWAYPTTEGDPIVSFAFVGPGVEGVETYTTTAFDSYGGGSAGSWSGTLCPDPRDVYGEGDCRLLLEG